jgi:hypothetical protein
MTTTRRPGAGRGRPVAARNPSFIATPASAGLTDGVK